MRIKKLMSYILVIAFTLTGTYVFSGGTGSDPSENDSNGVSAKASASRPESADVHMVSVVPITEVFADGWKVSAVAVEYDKNISDASLSPSGYIVKTDVAGQKIIKVYTSTDGEKTSPKSKNGRYVILELSTDYVIPVSTGTGSKSANQGPAPSNQGPGGSAQGSGGPVAMQSTTAKENLTLNSEVVTKVGNISWDPSAHPATLKSSAHNGNGKAVSVTQVGNITTTDGMIITACSSAKDNEYCRNLIVDGFLKPDYNDANNSRVKYNIHFPRNYDTAKKYPLVIFFADDSSSVRFTHAEPLTQGLGGVIWVDKNEEEKNACIAVVPAIRGSIFNENNESRQDVPNGPPSISYQTILNMMDYLIGQIPNIDKDRVYMTGQGTGAMAAIKIMTDRPDMFAAALLFAPEYDREKISKLSKANTWIVVSEGDDSVYSNMNGCIESLKTAGAHISKAVWNGQASPAQFAASVSKMIAEDNNIKYTVLKKGTVVRSGISDDTTNNHAYTWRTGYSIKGLRDWLFKQKK
jgi:predicted peptidase